MYFLRSTTTTTTITTTTTKAIKYLFTCKKMQQPSQLQKYRQDHTFSTGNKQYKPKMHDQQIPEIHLKMLSYVLKTAQKGNIKSCIDTIDEFCETNWMMNLGPEKGKIIKHVFSQIKPKNILQIGGYCGYSSLLFSEAALQANIHTIQIAPEFAQVSTKVHNHAYASVNDKRNHITIGDVSSAQKQITEKGPYDVVFIDHEKDLYLPDLKKLLTYGVIQKGCHVIADNIIFPGAPQYWEFFKQGSQNTGKAQKQSDQEEFDWDSTLYHSFDAYSVQPDAVLVSKKL